MSLPSLYKRSHLNGGTQAWAFLEMALDEDLLLSQIDAERQGKAFGLITAEIKRGYKGEERRVSHAQRFPAEAPERVSSSRKVVKQAEVTHSLKCVDFPASCTARQLTYW